MWMQQNKKILVPIANPETAGGLIKIASNLLHPDDGELIPLCVLSGQLEEEARVLDKITPLMEELKSAGYSIDLQTRKASNIARGILDAARDNSADLIVLGINRRPRGEIILGPIIENVIRTAPCPVIIYRPARASQFGRIVVPSDGTKPAQMACQIGWELSEDYSIEMEAIYVLPSYQPRWVGLGRLEQSLEGIKVEDSRRIKRTLAIAHDPIEGLLARVHDDDLIVVGYSERTGFERWLFGDFSRRVLDKAQCAVLLGALANESHPVRREIRQRLSRLSLRLTPAEQDDIVRQAYSLSSVNLDYLVLILIAAVLASLGLLLNSVAVIIGAMLVAPFMQPCIALGVGLTTGRNNLIRRSFEAFGSGIPLAFIIALLIGLLNRNHAPTAEMLARTNPSELDVFVAFASGLIGAYATARKEIPSALAGVAIAAALMPPLCTSGLEFAAGRFEASFQAGWLFLINIACITLAAWLVFGMIGMRRLRNHSDYS